MPRVRMKIWIAAVLAAAASPAVAGMPDIGTKNFTPGSDVPSYLTNENLAVAPGSPGQSPIGTAYNQPADPLPSVTAPVHATRSPHRHRDGLAAVPSYRRRGRGVDATGHRSIHAARVSTAHSHRLSGRSEMARAVWAGRKKAAQTRSATARRKTSARHASTGSIAPRG